MHSQERNRKTDRLDDVSQRVHPTACAWLLFLRIQLCWESRSCTQNESLMQGSFSLLQPFVLHYCNRPGRRLCSCLSQGTTRDHRRNLNQFGAWSMLPLVAPSRKKTCSDWGVHEGECSPIFLKQMGTLQTLVAGGFKMFHVLLLIFDLWCCTRKIHSIIIIRRHSYSLAIYYCNGKSPC